MTFLAGFTKLHGRRRYNSRRRLAAAVKRLGNEANPTRCMMLAGFMKRRVGPIGFTGTPVGAAPIVAPPLAGRRSAGRRHGVRGVA